MFTKNIFNQKSDAIVDLINKINEADYKVKMEALKGGQVKLDKNKNNKLDADDFKILRKDKRVNESETTSHGVPYKLGSTDAEVKSYPVHNAGEHVGNVEFHVHKGKLAYRAAHKAGASVSKSISHPDWNKNVDASVSKHKSHAMKHFGLNEEQIDEALRTVSTHGKGEGEHHAVVKRDPEWNEYQVHFYKGGKHMGEGPVSHHDDKADAQSTAEHEVKRMNAKNEAVSPFDWKNRPSELKKKPGETTGHDSKKTSTGTVYTKKAPKKPVEEDFDLESIDPALVEEFMQTEEFEQLDELSKKTLRSYFDKSHKDAIQTYKDVRSSEISGDKAGHKKSVLRWQKRIKGQHDAAKRTAPVEHQRQQKLMAKEDVEQTDEAATLQPKGPARVDVPAYKRVNLKPLSLKDVVTKSTEKKSNRPNAVKEESEQLDELSKETLKSYQDKAARSYSKAHRDSEYHRKHGNQEKQNAAGLKTFKRASGLSKAVDRLTKEESEAIDERKLSSGETAEKERIVHGMKKGLSGFKARYGSRAKEVMYATATAKAKK